MVHGHVLTPNELALRITCHVVSVCPSAQVEFLRGLKTLISLPTPRAGPAAPENPPTADDDEGRKKKNPTLSSLKKRTIT
jgi:hypothetical protein